MKPAALLMTVLLAGCFGSSETPESKPEDAPEGQAGKKRKGKKAAAGAEAPAAGAEAGDEKGDVADGPPILRTARYRIPLKGLADADVAAIRTAVIAAWEKAGKEGEATPNDEAAKAWKCRHVTVWPVEGLPHTPHLRLFERLTDPDCKKADAKEERWELSLRYGTTARPEKRDEGGKLRFLMASQDLDWSGTAWTDGFAAVYRADGGETDGGFPHDEAWLKEQLPASAALGKPVELDGARWLIANVSVAGEKVGIEAERWTCGGKEAGAELVFRTNKRAAGHTPTSPKDVVVTDKFKAFADAVAKELGDRAAAAGSEPDVTKVCAAP